MSSIVISGDISGTVTLDAPATAGTTVLTLPATSGTVLTQNPSAPANSLVVDASGNVGIGTASPTSKLSVGSASYSQTPSIGQVNGANVTTSNVGGLFNIGSTDAAAANIGGSLGFTANGGVNGYPTGQISGRRESATGSNYSSYLAFTTGDSGGTLAERMRIDSSGNVLVGATSNPNVGKIGVAFTAVTQSAWVSKPSADSGVTTMQFLNSSGGAVGAITQTASGTAYVTTSDYRLKENIAPMVGALDTVSLLKPVTYKWKIDGSDGQGFIAHELQEVVPDCVTGEKDAVNEDGSIKAQGVDTSFLVATLTAAIQELKAELDAVKTELATLKGAA